MIRKNIIITGGSRGLGKYLALQFAEESEVASITLIARNTANLKIVANQIKQKRPDIKIFSISGDLSFSYGIKKIEESLYKLNIDFNILINNAGYSVCKSLEETTNEEIDTTIYVNAIAPLRLIKFFTPIARKNKWGRIINISSISIFNPAPSIIPYVISKAALKSLTECIHLAEIIYGITCNTILPGLMLSDMGINAIKQAFPDYEIGKSKEIDKKITRNFPAKKYTDFYEIYNLLNYIFSDSANCISGEFFRVSSGML